MLLQGGALSREVLIYKYLFKRGALLRGRSFEEIQFLLLMAKFGLKIYK